MTQWLVSANLTRRLVEAEDGAQAAERFLAAVPRAHLLAGAREALSVREATESEVASFRTRRARPPETLALPMELPEPIRRRRARGA